MSSFTTVDLTLLDPPDIVEALDYEVIFERKLATLVELDPEFNALVESDPAYKILQLSAYDEMMLRQRINESCRALMLAYAQDADLDQIAANFGVQRLVAASGDPSAIPPVPETYESNEDLRRRVQLSFEGFTTAGSQGSYVFAALNASGMVRDANADSLVPGEVLVYVLSREGNGTASEQLIEAVRAAVNAEKVRPMTDKVTVLSAAVNEYEIEAVITTYPGPDSEVVRAAAQAAAQDYVDAMHRMAYDVTLSGLYAALHQAGVQRVDLIQPAATIVNGEGQASYCTSIAVTVAENYDV
ncbi:Phage-related baseplate assembly protein [Halopseudomonas litoralis]|uniref:Phage-related baseplate assembly protein n=1 Tax=Halopseudomonas litoralis TaxID=797277 RepID=A0A1H1SP34_9GAMM|nr:baseplate J/gp47 family protein [Halopseudomonas litoralis]SDS49750.1 Phage-related baseplate assembly protein [Halopseudomonas litoralis]